MTMPDFPTNLTSTAKDITTVAKDAGYVAVGLGVIGFQKAQVQRQELIKRLSDPRNDIETRLSEVRICLSKDLQFRPCEEIDRRGCRRDQVTMPPMRGG